MAHDIIKVGLLVGSMLQCLAAVAQPLSTLGIIETKSLAGVDYKRCNSSGGSCATDLLVSPGYVDRLGTVYTSGCHVIWGWLGFAVGQHAHDVMLSWTLKSLPNNDGSTFEFEAIGAQPRGFIDRWDMDSAVLSTDKQTFTWMDRNHRIRDDDNDTDASALPAIRFDFRVSRVASNGTRELCKSVDPVIINKGD